MRLKVTRGIKMHRETLSIQATLHRCLCDKTIRDTHRMGLLSFADVFFFTLIYSFSLSSLSLYLSSFFLSGGLLLCVQGKLNRRCVCYKIT